jgi:hypothetical protein
MLHVLVNAAFHVNASCPFLCPCTYMSECRNAGQSGTGTGLKKTNDARTGPVPD